jgi:hypothetical protein
MESDAPVEAGFSGGWRSRITGSYAICSSRRPMMTTRRTFGLRYYDAQSGGRYVMAADIETGGRFAQTK